VSVQAELRRAISQLPYLRRALGLIWDAAHWWGLVWITLLLLQGLLPVATVYLSRAGVDSLVAATRTPAQAENIRQILVIGALIAAVLLLGEALRGAGSYVRTALSELVQDHISALIQKKAVAVDLSFYDSPSFYDHLHRAKDGAPYRAVSLVDNLGTLMLAMGIVLLRYNVWLPAVLLLGTLPAVAVVLHYGWRQHQLRQRTTTGQRRAWYYESLQTTAEPAAEMRLFDLGPHFQNAYRTLRQKLRNEQLQMSSSRAWAELGAGVVSLAVIAAAALAMIWRTLRGTGTLGDLVLFYQACQQGLQLMRSLLQSVGQFHSNLLFLSDLFEFLSLESQLSEPAAAKPPLEQIGHGIRFREVTFRYPGSARTALDRFDLFLPANRVTALVGANGAGKSTLIKLLTRFYDPDSGRIEIDGMDLREFALADLRSRVTVLFQQPIHYNATVRENIEFGDLRAMPSDQSIGKAAVDAGVDEIVTKLPNGLDTLLGRAFADDGAELSVGEWQRLALARAFLRRAPILVLDEPTSAMDPWAEAEWLERFQTLAAGRTVVIITHRFTTARIADLICVVDDGRIVESGTHQELLAREGRYAQGWSSGLKVKEL
jgi:ATP-binding cassette, subfamily B, bacterial